jgi:hypothetical protein
MPPSRYSRRRLPMIAAVASALTLAPAFAESAFAVEAVTEAISHRSHRSVVMDRARTWVGRGIQYSQSGTAEDAERNHTYRRDCSGFVSMRWHLQPSGIGCPNTNALAAG